MASFKDMHGREWKPQLTVGMLKPLREDHGFDGKVIVSSGEKLGELLMAEPEKLVGIMYVMCEDQAKELKVSPEDFAKACDGPTLEGAGEALVKTVIGFFHRSTVAKSLIEKAETIFTEIDKQTVAAIEKIGSSDSPTNSAE